MDKFLPDCGVLSSPSSTSGQTRITSLSLPKLSTVAATMEPAAKLGAGSSVLFYKSPKAGPSRTHTPTVSPSPSQLVRPARGRRPGGDINRGVGHGIKKPKMKAKDKKASNPAKVSVRRLKQVKPPPRLAEHRSPAALGISPALGGKKRFQLSSPGVSLLDSPDSGCDLLANSGGEASGSSSSKSFFTSRARAAATVQISKNVTLSASYGEISLRRGTSAGLKKNVGRTAFQAVTKLNTSPVTTSPILATLSSLSSSSNNSTKPKPTRFPGTPSPHKRKLSALNSDRLPSKENQSCSDATEPATRGARSSPRRMPLMPINSSNLLLPPPPGRATTPKKTPRLLDLENADPSGKRVCSPAKEGSSSKSSSPRRRASTSSGNNTPTKKDRDLSPRRLVLSKSTPTKVVEVRMSPRKATVLSPSKIALRNVVIEVVHQSPNAKAVKSPLRVQRNGSVASPLKNLHLSPQQSTNIARMQGSPGRLLLRNSPLRRQLKETSNALEGNDQSANVNDVSTDSSRSPFKRLKETDFPAVDDATSTMQVSPSKSKTSDILSNGTPSKSTSTPSKSTSTPSKSTSTPSKSTSTPSKSTSTPSKSKSTPSKSKSTPSKSKSTPSKSKSTPSKSKSTPSKSKSTPSKSKSTPSKSKSTPSKSKSTPSKSKETPSKCNGTASRSKNTPSKSSAAASECQSSTLELTPSKSTRASLSQAQSTSDSNGTSSSIESPRKPKSTRATPLKDGQNDTPKVKYFPVFDPEKRRTHDKNGKQKSSRSSTGVRGPLGDPNQRMLDAGQRQYGATQCAQCGLVYEYGDPDDDLVHTAHHNRIMTALAYTNWKKERQVTNLDSRGGRCVLVTPSDPQYCWRKVREVLAVVDEELGFEDGTSAQGENCWVFLYIIESKVAGCLVAERVNKAHRVVPSKDTLNKNGISPSMDDLKSSDSHSEDVELLCCSIEPVPTKFGVSRIWVKNDARRMGLASKMVDAFRANLLPCVYLQLDDFAFSDPTPSGMKFAQSYTHKEDFLVYRHGV